MDAGRMLLYFVGGALVIGGIVMLFFETGLSAWVPAGVALAGLIILVGLFVVGLSGSVDEDEHYVEEHHHHRD